MKYLILLLSLFYSWSLFGQRFYQPSGRMYDIETQHDLLSDSSYAFSTIKPILIPFEDSLYSIYQKLQFKKWMRVHFIEDDFLKFKGEDHVLTINPIFDFQRSFDLNVKNDTKVYFLNTRGFEAFGKIGKKIYFSTEFFENQGRFLFYEDSIINLMHGLPGQGYAKRFKGNSNDWSGKDWALAFGTISVVANKNLTISLGNGQNFIGSGHRSVLLSDVSFNYPFIRTDLKFKNFYYYVLWQYLACDKNTAFFVRDSYYKYGSYHILGWKPNSKLEFTIVEGVMWKNTDKNGNYKYSPNMEMFLPIIFYPFLAHGFNKDTRVQLGWDVNYSPNNKLKFYQQFNYQGKNNVRGEKYSGFQLGFHLFDFLFGSVCDLNTHLQLEYNYSNISDGKLASSISNGKSCSDFWHYGYPLTTLNVVDYRANELLAFVEFDYKRFCIEGRVQESDWVDRQTVNFRYIFNKKTKWNLYFSLQHREANIDTRIYDNNIFQMGIQIGPRSFYYDF